MKEQGTLDEQGQRYPPPRHGYVVAASRELVLMHVFHDFTPEGYSVIRTSEIERVECGPNQRFWGMINEREGLLKGLESVPEINLDSMARALQSLTDLGQYFIIDCEDRDEPSDEFFLGSIESMDDYWVRFWHFDTLGSWHEEPALVRVDEITALRFDNPYTRVYSQYVKPMP